MTQPLDVIMAFHNAFRVDMERIDTAALEAARGKVGLEPTIARYQFFNEILIWHATGEEKEIYPVLERVAPLVAEAYVMDHHGLDTAGEGLHAAFTSGDPLQTARAAAAFKFHLDLHLKKEDAHLYRLFRERIPLPEQGQALGKMSTHVPQERFPEVVAWMFPLLGIDDRENTTRIFQSVFPAPAFAGVKLLIRKAIGDDWAELERRIPTLADV
jgi:hemerythrin-like domain-containing protein